MSKVGEKEDRKTERKERGSEGDEPTTSSIIKGRNARARQYTRLCCRRLAVLEMVERASLKNLLASRSISELTSTYPVC